MPEKLEELITQVVIKAGADNDCSSIPSELIAAAAKVAPLLTPADVAKFPSLWYPPLTAKAAGAPKLKDGWERLWFEALVEVLYQAGSVGLPALFELLERDTKTYHALVVVRLLRLAAANVQKKVILDKVKARLPEMGHGEGPESVQEVMLWAARGDQRLTKFLRSMAKLKLKGIGEETVDSVMKEWAESRAIYL
jgi:hypothetical protein